MHVVGIRFADNLESQAPVEAEVGFHLGVEQHADSLREASTYERIYALARLVPAGKVATYGQIARLADLPGYARYVGYTMKMLPSGTRLPWYRARAHSSVSTPSAVPLP